MILSLLFKDFEAAQLCLHFGKQDVASVSAQIWLIWTLILLRIDWFGPWFWVEVWSTARFFQPWLQIDCRIDPLIEFLIAKKDRFGGFLHKNWLKHCLRRQFERRIADCGRCFFEGIFWLSIFHHRIDNWRVWLILKVCHAHWNSQLTQINQEDLNGSGWDTPN